MKCFLRACLVVCVCAFVAVAMSGCGGEQLDAGTAGSVPEESMDEQPPDVEGGNEEAVADTSAGATPLGDWGQAAPGIAVRIAAAELSAEPLTIVASVGPSVSPPAGNKWLIVSIEVDNSGLTQLYYGPGVRDEYDQGVDGKNASFTEAGGDAGGPFNSPGWGGISAPKSKSAGAFAISVPDVAELSELTLVLDDGSFSLE